MIVVDASALASFILKEPGWKRLVKYLMNAVSVDHVVKEVSNALWKACMRGLISKEDALKLYNILSKMININIVLESEDKYIRRALEIGLEYNSTVYDSLYLALAEEKGMPLLSLDRKQIAVAEKLGIKVIDI